MNIKYINSLRWVAVLPASILGSLLANFLGVLYAWINSGGYSWYTGDNTIGIVELCLFVLQNGLTGAAFVAAGWYVAPNYKNIIKVVLATIASCVCILSIIVAQLIATVQWHTYVSVIATIAGAIYSAYNLRCD